MFLIELFCDKAIKAQQFILSLCCTKDISSAKKKLTARKADKYVASLQQY